MTFGCNCGRHWSGLSQAHCTVCHEHFSSVAGFDRHRTTGRCVPPSNVTRRDGRPHFKADHNRFGTTWVEDDPRGHYRTRPESATATTEEPTR